MVERKVRISGEAKNCDHFPFNSCDPVFHFGDRAKSFLGSRRRKSKNGASVIKFRRMANLSRRTFLGGAALRASAFHLRAEAMGIPPGTQTYPFRNELAKDIPGTLKALAGIGTRRIELCSPWSYREFAGFKDYRAADLKKLLDSNNIVAESCHYGMPELKSNLDERLAWAKELGMKQMILASMPVRRQNATLAD